MKQTKLQGRLISHYENSKTDLGGNSEYLEKITKLAGNRGLSHKQRIKRINNWTHYLENSLSESEKTYIDQVLRINGNYVKTTSRTREIKNAYDVRQNIATLRTRIRTSSLEENVDSNERQLGNLSTSIAEPTQIEDYQPTSQKYNQNHRFLRRVGSVLLPGLITLGFTAGITASGLISYKLGKKSQEPTITKQQLAIKEKGEQITNLSTTLEQGREHTLKLNEMLLDSKTNYTSLKQQKNNLEQELIAAGRPDYEVRQEAVQSTTEKLRIKCEEKRVNELAVIAEAYLSEDAELTPFQESIWSKGLVTDSNTLREQYLQPTKTLHPTDVNDSSTISPLVNTEWENRMAMAGEKWLEPENCECADIGFEKQQYLKDKFMEYPSRIGKDHIKKNWKEKKPIRFLGSLVGGALATVNDGLEFFIARPVAGAAGAVLGTGSRILGNKNEGLKKGWKDGNKIAAFVMDGIPGGVSKNAFDAYLLQGKFKKALKVPYCMEDTRLGGHVKTGEIIVSNTLSILGLTKDGGKGHHHAGGFERVGGEVGTGAGRTGGVVK